MKKNVVFFMLFFLAKASYSQFERPKQVYESPKLKESIKKHKTVAILPFKTTISYKRVPKDYNKELVQEEETKMAANFQTGMYTYLLRKASDYSVSFQDVERTNALLKQNGIFNKLDTLTNDSIAKVLGVDAVIRCSYAYQKTGSEGGAIAKTLLLGVGTGKVASGGLTMQIYDKVDGELLWRFYKEMNEDVLSSGDAVMERMMRKVGRNFPYEK